MTSCFVYKVMGLTFHDRINTQLIQRFELAQVVVRTITKPQRFFFRFESHWLLFFIQFFSLIFIFGRGGGLNSYSRMCSEFTVVCVVTDVFIYMPYTC